MNGAILLADIKSILLSKRTALSVALMAASTVVVALIVQYSPSGLRAALAASAPASAGVFEFMWFEDVMALFFPLVIVGYGAFALCDLEDADMTGLLLSRPESRLSFLARRVAAAIASFLVVFLACSAVAAGIGAAAGGLDVGLFLVHQLMLLPLCLFVLGLTFFLSVPLRTTTPTALTSFAICLALYFAYSFLLAAGGGLPSPLNPMCMGHRMLVDASIIETATASLGYACVLFAAGAVWFVKKDL